MKSIRIACQGATQLDIDQIKPLQGNLKTLSKENYDKLRKEILELGFSEPISVWKKDGHNYAVNGHQRLRVLQEMRHSEKYVIPEIPISIVEAPSEHEAKKKILALTSQYGEITNEGLYEFLAEADIGLNEAIESFRFPEIDFENFLGEFGDFELDEPAAKEAPESYALEVSFSNEKEMLDNYDRLIKEGLIVRIKNG